MKNQHLTRAAIVAVIAAPVLVQAAGDELPKQPAFARYEAMMNRSPFAVATAVAVPAATPNFAKDLYIANAARLPDESVVTLSSSTDKNMKEYISTKEANQHGYKVEDIEWSERVGATKVTISKDGQIATLTFNQALLSQPNANPVIQQPQAAVPQAAAVPPAPSYPVPGTVQNNGAAAGAQNVIKPAPVPMLPTPPPNRVRGVIQRNPNPAQVSPEKTGQTAVPDDQ
jgi:hypothetical protein